VFERFTDRARNAVELAQAEARELGHDHVGIEHILLGLLREEEGLAARVLRELGVTVEDVHPHVAALEGRRDEIRTGAIPFTPRAKKALELALRESLSFGHDYIGTEHILLGLVRVEDGAGLLAAHDAKYERVRDCVLTMLPGDLRPGRGRKPSLRAVRSDARESHQVLAILAAFGIGVLVGKAIAAQ
jgi:ATP-dependent Clp protease ATP-binding subunit ClpC